MKLLTTNLCTESSTSITASSANPSFPVSNLSSVFRSKRWRSSGTFVIDATNNKINFKESGGGSELTATITSGSYSITTLKTEIKTQMDSVGASDYIINYNSVTGIWSVVSNGSYFSLLNNTGTNQAVALFKVSLGFSNTDKTGSLTYSGSLVAIHTKESVVFDLKTIQDIDSVILMWPKEDGIRLSSSAVIKVEANATNVWTSPAVSQTLNINDDYLIASHYFSSVQQYRYWRITIEDSQNPLLYVELGLCWIGENIEFNEPENGFKYDLMDLSKSTKTDYGHEYVDEYPLTAVLSFTYNYILYSTLQILENAYRQNGIKKPVIIVFDENGSVFNKDHFVIYGKFENMFSSGHVSYNLFNGELKITELS
jgi:hypothetical protein